MSPRVILKCVLHPSEFYTHNWRRWQK